MNAVVKEKKTKKESAIKSLDLVDPIGFVLASAKPGEPVTVVQPKKLPGKKVADPVEVAKLFGNLLL